MSVVAIPPGPRCLLPGYHLFAFRRDPLRFLTELARTYGDVAQFFVGPQRVVLFNHPDLIKEVLVTRHDHFVKGRALQRAKLLLGEGLLTSEGDFHRRQRRLIQPAFHRQRIAAYADVMADCAVKMTHRWRDGATVDIAREMMRLTLAVVGKTLFDAEVESDADDVGRALADLMDLFELLMMPYSELIERFLIPSRRKFERARAKLDSIIYRIIEERRRSGEDRGDLLSMLLLARDTDGDQGGMTDEQVRDEAMTLFLAGHETTANALAWTWYRLAQHPEVERRLHQEVDQVLGERLPRFADLPDLAYTEMVFAEAMRLYPPAWVIGRLVVRPVEIGGYFIPAGSLVLVSQYVMHRDARYFPDPERFDPERWRPENKQARPPYSYFPFGGGPRRCIGEAFAWLEGIIVLATMARSWRMRLVSGQRIEPLPRITLRPKNGLLMRLERRESASSVSSS